MIHRLKANHARANSDLMHAWNNRAAQKHSKLKIPRPSVHRWKGLEKEYHHLHNYYGGFENLDDHEEDHEQDEKYLRLFHHGDLSNNAVNHAKPMHFRKPNTAQKIQRLISEKPLMQHDRNFAKGYKSLHNGHDHLEDEYDHEDAYDYEDFEEDKEYEVDEYVLPEDDHEVKLPHFEPKNVYQKIPNKDIEHNEQEIDQFKQQLSSLFHPRQILKHTGLQPEEFHWILPSFQLIELSMIWSQKFTKPTVLSII